ncbi:hypothetical protein FNW52_05810 [Flavobacterium sp. ZT3R18]|uniref:hypothetical protein n=1 Tax=Flavobacterium sp. ZT3R18 TaxID=2594429 RepID=UPI001179CD71|nr:hypothetical protein [Flavobacterium sp. ZT3R18]TRX36755.1 hypothetical protein FNW52_05810 [Flavobacterium sp. ZT3R18]
MEKLSAVKAGSFSVLRLVFEYSMTLLCGHGLQIRPSATCIKNGQNLLAAFKTIVILRPE